jgi:hypothetical protein
MMSVIGHFFLNFVVGASSTWLQDLRRNNKDLGDFLPMPRSFSPPGGIKSAFSPQYLTNLVFSRKSERWRKLIEVTMR